MIFYFVVLKIGRLQFPQNPFISYIYKFDFLKESNDSERKIPI